MIENIILTELVIALSLFIIWILLLFDEIPYKISKKLIVGCGLGIFIAGMITIPMSWRLIFTGFYFLIIDTVLEAIR